MDYMQELASGADALVGSGDYDGANKKYDEILELNDTVAEIWLNKGTAHSRAGQQKKALESFLKACELKPELEIAHVNVGSLYSQLDDLPNAEASYRRALELNKSSASTWTNLAHVLNQLKRYEDAISVAEDGFSVLGDADLTSLYTEQIISFVNLNRLSDALESVDIILRSAPLDSISKGQCRLYGLVLYQKGSSLFQEAKHEQALKYLERSIELDETDEAQWSRGACFLQLDRDNEAATALKRAIELNPGCWRGLISLGTMHARNHEWEKAAEYFERCMDFDNSRNIPSLHFSYAIALMQLGRDFEAKNYLELVINAEPSNTVALGLLGTAYIACSDFENAVKSLNKSIDLSEPTHVSPTVAYNLGYAYLMLGNLEKAKLNFDRVIEIDPQNEAAIFALSSLPKVNSEKTSNDTLSEEKHMDYTKSEEGSHDLPKVNSEKTSNVTLSEEKHMDHTKSEEGSHDLVRSKVEKGESISSNIGGDAQVEKRNGEMSDEILKAQASLKAKHPPSSQLLVYLDPGRKVLDLIRLYEDLCDTKRADCKLK